jgi:hypothetical protein
MKMWISIAYAADFNYSDGDTLMVQYWSGKDEYDPHTFDYIKRGGKMDDSEDYQ